MDELFRVEIVEDESGAVVKSLPASSARQAEKLENGMMRNLNHAKYFTRIVSRVSAPGAVEGKEA
jgi:hypothetical protein